MRGKSVLILTLLLSGCAAGGAGDYRAYLAKKGVTQIAPSGFSHCRGYGCRHIDEDLRLSEQDWLELRALFLPPIENAADERRRISEAIGLFERKTGALTGTAADIEGTYHRLGDYQQDCVDESVNTTVYLSLLEQQGLLLYHRVGSVTARIPLLSGRLGPHQSATIVEKESGNSFVVDSWFHDNGHPAEIVPLDRWFTGWRPDG